MPGNRRQTETDIWIGRKDAQGRDEEKHLSNDKLHVRKSLIRLMTNVSLGQKLDVEYIQRTCRSNTNKTSALTRR